MLPATPEPEFAGIGRRIRIYPHALILRHESIVIDDDARVDAFTRIEGGVFTWIGQGTHIAGHAVIMGGGECVIGQRCAISRGVTIVTGVGHPMYEQFDPVPPSGDVFHVKRGRVVIGDYVFIGVMAIILPDVTIGDGAVIAAGTLIARDVPAWAIMAGSPARQIGIRRNWMLRPTD